MASEQLSKWQGKQPVEETVYQTKKIQFFGRAVLIILQNKNGPCPLIAICNILLLRNKIDLSPDVTHVSEGQLITLVAESLFESLNDDNSVETVADARDSMPNLTAGMNVNVKFKRIDDFELTKENEIFGLLGIPLVHGWLIDPQDTETSKAIGSKSFNTLIEELVVHIEKVANSDGVISGSSINPNEDVGESSSVATTSNINVDEAVISGSSINPNEEDNAEVKHLEKENIEEGVDPTSANSDGVISGSSINPNEDVGSSLEANKASNDVGESGSLASTSNVNVDEAETIAKQGELIKSFLDNNPNQLTVYGLFCLQAGLKEQELCVFFRNNHFNTVFRFAGELYILVTDQGCIDQPGVVWEKLTEVNGDTVFVNSNFLNFNPGNHEIEEIPEPDEKSVKKKDTESVLKMFEDHLEGLIKTGGSSNLSPGVKKALELLGLEEKDLLMTHAETVMKKFEDHLDEIIRTQGSSNFNPDLKKALELLGLDEKDLYRAQPEPLPIVGPEPEAGNPGPEPEEGNPGPEPMPKRNYSILKQVRIPSKKAKRIKEKCGLM